MWLMSRRWLFVVVLAALAVAIPVTSSSGASVPSNLMRARQEAARLLALLHVPPGAVELAAEPKGDGGVLRVPGYDEATPNLVDVHRWWTVQGKATNVLAYVAARLPRAAKWYVSGSGGPRPVYYMKGFALPPIPGVMAQRVLAVSVVQLTSTTTAIRTDGEVVWIIPRPASEKLSTTVHEIDITSAYPGRPPLVAVSVVGPAAKRIVKWINALGVAQPGTINCPALPLGPFVRFVFRTSRGTTVAHGSVLDFDGTSGECNAIDLSIHGRQRMPLIGGNLLERLQRLLGVRFD